MAQMSHPIKHDSLPRVPLCAHNRFAQNSFFVLRTKSSASMALTKKTNKKNKKKTTTTKQNNPPPQKKKNKNNNNNKKKNKTTKTTKNSNKQITKTDKTQQTNVALATARAYKICYKCVCILIILIYSEQHLG